MRIAIVVEAIPPYCGGGEQVAWIHAVEMAKKYEVAVFTFGEALSWASRDGVDVCFLPRRKHNLAAYSSLDRRLLNECVDHFSPSIIHCHMPNILCACVRKTSRLLVSTIHGSVSEKDVLELGYMSRARLLKFRLVRYLNFNKSDLITCVSQSDCRALRSLYPKHAEKFVFIPNPIYDRFFSPVTPDNDGFILNFGRQLPQKMGALLEVAKLMPERRFVFVGTGSMAKDHGLPNVHFIGFSGAVENYIDKARLCVFPSLLELFPLVGLEAMARGKPVLASRRGFSEYIKHMKNGFLLDSVEPKVIADAINLFLEDEELCSRIGLEARRTAEEYRPAGIIQQYEELYRSLRVDTGIR